jgi:hypothetical protein
MLMAYKTSPEDSRLTREDLIFGHETLVVSYFFCYTGIQKEQCILTPVLTLAHTSNLIMRAYVAGT